MVAQNHEPDPQMGGQEQRSDVPTGNTFKELLFAGDLLFG